ncbi:helix-turn-helix domain-containing protein [Tenacibaculum sp. SSH1-16]|uniref:helix-turn-helix domain-containing protein n=1 Tax=Tenacibaculum sp. SSH1-16 TaxID=3136667 RepID=UPI0032C43DB3
MHKINLIQVTPNQLEELIEKKLTEQFEDLKKQLQPKKQTNLLTRDEAIKLLQINLSTLYKYTKQGKLQAYKLGKRVYYKREEIENAIINPKNVNNE